MKRNKFYILSFFHNSYNQLVINAIGIQTNVIFKEYTLNWSRSELNINLITDLPLKIID